MRETAENEHRPRTYSHEVQIHAFFCALKMEGDMTTNSKSFVVTLVLLATNASFTMELPTAIDEQPDTSLETMLHKLVRNGNPENVHEYLAKQTMSLDMEWESGHIDEQDSLGYTALHHAAYQGNDEITQLLLKYGATADAQDAYNETPLHHATRRGHIGVITTLLHAGATINARNVNKQTPLHLAARLITAGPSLIATLLAHGADPEARDYSKQTPLHCAWTPDKIHALTKGDTNTETRDKYNFTALHAAVRWEAPEVVRVLLEANAKMKEDETTWHKLTPMRHASKPLPQEMPANSGNSCKRQRFKQ